MNALDQSEGVGLGARLVFFLGWGPLLLDGRA